MSAPATAVDKRAKPSAGSDLELSVPNSALLLLVAQFLHDANLHDTLSALVREAPLTQCPSFSSAAAPVDASRVRAGDWDSVLAGLLGSVSDRDSVLDLLEHICWDLGPALSKELCGKSPVLQHLSQTNPARFAQLAVPPKNLPERREALARAVEAKSAAAAAAPEAMLPGRLLAQVQDALRWRRLEVGGEALRASGDPLALYSSQPAPPSMTLHALPSRLVARRRFVKGVRGECAAFSPDGQTLAVGMSDGFVELLAARSLRPRPDLAFQAERPLLAPARALCVGFSLDSGLLACGDAEGSLHVWRVLDGALVKHFRRAHSHGVTCVGMSPDGAKVLSGGADALGRVFGLVAGTQVSELRGHAGALNSCVFAAAGRCFTASQDGSVRGWSAGTGQALFACELGAGPVLRLVGLPGGPAAAGVSAQQRVDAVDRLWCLTERALVAVQTDSGVAGAQSLPSPGVVLVDFCVARSGKEKLGVTRQGELLCWDEAGSMVRRLPELAAVGKDEAAVQVLYHPVCNLVCVLGSGGAAAFD